MILHQNIVLSGDGLNFPKTSLNGRMNVIIKLREGETGKCPWINLQEVVRLLHHLLIDQYMISYRTFS